MRPVQRLEAGVAGAPVVPPPAGAPVVPVVPPPARAGAGACGAAAGSRSVIVRRAVVLRPPARRSASLIVARPPAARSAATPLASKRSAIAETDRLASLTLREAIVRLPAVTPMLPLSTERFGLATSTVAAPALETAGALGLIFTGAAW